MNFAKTCLPVAALTVCSTSPALLAQDTLYSVDGVAAKDRFGLSASGAGDVDGDMIPDFVVGAHLADANGVDSGMARVHSGVDGSVIWTFDGAAAADEFGFAVSGAGDVDNDGRADVIIGAWGSDVNGAESGQATVYSGLDASVLHTFDGALSGDRLGYAVARAGDVNGDNHDDVIVGIWGHDGVGANSGQAMVYSGIDGSVLWTFDGTALGDEFGKAVAGDFDANFDGTPDLAVGAPNSDAAAVDAGQVVVYSGADGSVLNTFDGAGMGDHFGQAVSGAGDVDNDNHDDVIVGAPNAAFNGTNSGRATVFSGFDGNVLYEADGDNNGDYFGWSVSGAGNVNGDPFDDFIVGAWGDDNTGPISGSARVFSGSNGIILSTFNGGNLNDLYGYSVSDLGDVNGDGRDDMLVGAPFADITATNSGAASVISFYPLGTNYCSPAELNSTGEFATVFALGSLHASANTFLLVALDLPPNQFGYFLTSKLQGFVMGPGGSQGNLCLGSPLSRFALQIQNSGPAGAIAINVDLSHVVNLGPVLAGSTWHFQCWYRDQNPTSTSNFSDALEVMFQ